MNEVSPCKALSGPSGGCRIREFAMYDCVALRYERRHLAGVLQNKAAFMDAEYRAAIEHDLTDIDYLLSQLETSYGLEHSKELP